MTMKTSMRRGLTNLLMLSMLGAGGNAIAKQYHAPEKKQATERYDSQSEQARMQQLEQALMNNGSASIMQPGSTKLADKHYDITIPSYSGLPGTFSYAENGRTLISNEAIPQDLARQIGAIYKQTHNDNAATNVLLPYIESRLGVAASKADAPANEAYAAPQHVDLATYLREGQEPMQQATPSAVHTPARYVVTPQAESAPKQKAYTAVETQKPNSGVAYDLRDVNGVPTMRVFHRDGVFTYSLEGSMNEARVAAQDISQQLREYSNAGKPLPKSLDELTNQATYTSVAAPVQTSAGRSPSYLDVERFNPADLTMTYDTPPVDVTLPGPDMSQVRTPFTEEATYTAADKHAEKKNVATQDEDSSYVYTGPMSLKGLGQLRKAEHVLDGKFTLADLVATIDNKIPAGATVEAGIGYDRGAAVPTYALLVPVRGGAFDYFGASVSSKSGTPTFGLQGRRDIGSTKIDGEVPVIGFYELSAALRPGMHDGKLGAGAALGAYVPISNTVYLIGRAGIEGGMQFREHEMGDSWMQDATYLSVYGGFTVGVNLK